MQFYAELVQYFCFVDRLALAFEQAFCDRSHHERMEICSYFSIFKCRKTKTKQQLCSETNSNKIVEKNKTHAKNTECDELNETISFVPLATHFSVKFPLLLFACLP